MAGRGRRSRSVVRLPRAGSRLSRDRSVPLPPEGRATPPGPRGREPGLPRLGAHLARAPLTRPSGPRQRRPRAPARAGEPRRKPGGPSPGDPLSQQRVSSARDDPDPGYACRRRRAGQGAQGRSEEDQRDAAQARRGPPLGARRRSRECADRTGRCASASTRGGSCRRRSQPSGSPRRW